MTELLASLAAWIFEGLPERQPCRGLVLCLWGVAVVVAVVVTVLIVAATF